MLAMLAPRNMWYSATFGGECVVYRHWNWLPFPAFPLNCKRSKFCNRFMNNINILMMQISNMLKKISGFAIKPAAFVWFGAMVSRLIRRSPSPCIHQWHQWIVENWVCSTLWSGRTLAEMWILVLLSRESLLQGGAPIADHFMFH